MIDFAGEVATALAPVIEELRAVRAELAALRAASPPRLVDVREACRMTGLSPATMRRRIKDKTIPSVRVGRSVRVNVLELAAEAKR